jgi:protein PsiE
LQGKEKDQNAMVYGGVTIVIIADGIVNLRQRNSDKLGLRKKRSK